MPPARSIHLTPVETGTPAQVYRQTEQADLRTRCQMILLSAQGRSAAEIAELTFFEQDTVLFWFDRYEAEGLTGLEDRPRSGRPPRSGRMPSQRTPRPSPQGYGTFGAAFVDTFGTEG